MGLTWGMGINPTGVESNSPRLTRGTRAYLGLGTRRYCNPIGVVWQAGWNTGADATPMGLGEYGIIFPKVAACRRNLGLLDTIPMGLENIQFGGWVPPLVRSSKLIKSASRQAQRQLTTKNPRITLPARHRVE